MEAASSSEMLVPIYQSTWHYSPGNWNHHQHCCENHKSYEVQKHGIPYKTLLLNGTMISQASQ
jgi:hypothetical protein